MNKEIKIGDVLDLVWSELETAQATHPPFNSFHEGYSIMNEEVFEMWMEVIKKNPDKAKLKAEAVQVAAMACRFAIELCEEGER